MQHAHPKMHTNRYGRWKILIYTHFPRWGVFPTFAFIVLGTSFKCTECEHVGDKKDWREHILNCGNSLNGQALARLGSKKSRAKVSLSADGRHAIVKQLLHPERNHQGHCKLVISERLFHLRCTKGCGEFEVSARSEYLWCRRRARKTLGLLSVSAPLDSGSFIAFDHAAKSCGIVSNTHAAHLTLVEGYRLPLNMNNYHTWLESTMDKLIFLRNTVKSKPEITIESLETVPRLSDERTVLVVANVTSSFVGGEAARTLTRDCALPQFPLHLAVGACAVGSVEDALAFATKKLVGLTLKVDVKFLSVLAPSLDDKFFPGVHSAETFSNRRAVNDSLFQQAVGAATYAAMDINRALYQSSVDARFG